MKTAVPLGELVGASSDQMARDMMKRLKEAAEIVAEACRLKADRFSTRIPLSLVVKSDSKGVYILGGGPKAPNAYPFDPPDTPPVWHPVHATGPRSNWHWAPQPYRPFLEEGAEASATRAAEQFANVIDDWAKQLGKDRP
jgi:hypothetical protein